MVSAFSHDIFSHVSTVTIEAATYKTMNSLMTTEAATAC
jgi:hypothetical protein